jgi:hypothetical protein
LGGYFDRKFSYSESVILVVSGFFPLDNKELLFLRFSSFSSSLILISFSDSIFTSFLKIS